MAYWLIYNFKCFASYCYHFSIKCFFFLFLHKRITVRDFQHYSTSSAHWLWKQTILGFRFRWKWTLSGVIDIQDSPRKHQENYKTGTMRHSNMGNIDKEKKVLTTDWKDIKGDLLYFLFLSFPSEFYLGSCACKMSLK